MLGVDLSFTAERLSARLPRMNVCDLIGILAALVPVVFACDSCYGPINHVEHVRHVKRMQPGAQGASYGPTRPLEWGQLNFLHTVS